ncbi:pickpocket protein 28 [Sergentomyia squamirostris]
MNRNIRSGSFRKALWGFFSDYCDNSSIHGVKYLGERRRPWTERVWWCIAFVLSISGCSIFIWSSWTKWNQSPVIVTFADKSTPVWQIPFPAITICPETKFKMEYLNFTKAFVNWRDNDGSNLTEKEKLGLETVYHLCNHDIIHEEHYSFGSDYANDSLLETLEEMAPNHYDVFFVCLILSNASRCDSFTTIVTDEGICFTSNLLSAPEIYRQSHMHSDYSYHWQERKADHWTLEEGYDAKAPLQTYPERVLGASVRAGYFIWLQLNTENFDYMCRGPVQGFRILLHTPAEIPQVSRHYISIPLNQVITVSVKPSMFSTSKALKNYEPTRRQCYFNHERQLHFFRIYTQRNCNLECLSLYTKKKCGCVRFFMPRDNDTLICGTAKVSCYNAVEYELLRAEVTADLQKNYSHSPCNCLPACTSIVYDAEISQTDVEWRKMLNAYRVPEGEFNGTQFAAISLFFKDTQFITSRRSELYGWTHFIANCGGLLGLFMGVSLLSIIEIIYFFTIRLRNNFLMRRRCKNIISKINVIVPKPQKATV